MQSGSDDNITIVLAEFGDLKRETLNLQKYDEEGNIIINGNRKQKKTLLKRLLQFFT